MHAICLSRMIRIAAFAALAVYGLAIVSQALDARPREGHLLLSAVQGLSAASAYVQDGRNNALFDDATSRTKPTSHSQPRSMSDCPALSCIPSLPAIAMPALPDAPGPRGFRFHVGLQLSGIAPDPSGPPPRPIV